METIEYHNVIDKSKWGRGPWDDEPDKIQWQDLATGLPCMALRNDMGAWCGYVGVDKDNPAYGAPYQDIEEHISAHGGLSYASECSLVMENGVPNHANSICHLPADGEPDHVWWFGFDCAHAFDLMPGHVAYIKERVESEKRGETNHGWSDKSLEYVRPPHTTYRNLAYVQAECARLAHQLKYYHPK